MDNKSCFEAGEPGGKTIHGGYTNGECIAAMAFCSRIGK